MTVTKDPGFDNLTGTYSGAPRSRNRRLSRYLAQAEGGGNHADNRHKQVRDITIAFVSPDQITDTGNRFAQFQVAEVIEPELTPEDGPLEIDVVVAGQIDTIEQTISAQAAGADYLIKTRNNRIDSRF